jgi:hypothetical protein
MEPSRHRHDAGVSAHDGGTGIRHRHLAGTGKRDASGNPVMCWPYALLPEDPKGLEPGTDVLKVLQSVGDMEKASLGQIRRYLVLCIRGERFCDGYIAGQFESGLIQAALRGLKQIRGGSKKEPAKRAGYE